MSLTADILQTRVPFLIDSGVERSLIPLKHVPRTLLTDCKVSLLGVNGQPIPVFGQCRLTVAVRGLRRAFEVTFVAADSIAILGADFITEAGLQLDMRARKLSDPLTGRHVELSPFRNEPLPSIRVVDSNFSALSDFPSLTKPPNYTSASPVTVEHAIEVTGGPVSCKARVLSPAKYDIAKAEFDKLLQMGIIRPSSSPWASPLHVVKKADGTWRPCGDYRALNALTKPDRYVIPNIETFHHRLRGAKIFSKIDLVKAYYFIPVAAEDVPKTAICTPFGSFEFLRLPFGLRNASGTFQRFLDSIFRDLPFVVSYIDDIMIFSDSPEQHEEHLRTVLSRLDEKDLRIHPSKCVFASDSIEFLGFRVSAEGIRPLPSRVEALCALPPPADEKELRRYVGMFNFYQRCIPHFAATAAPLRELLSSDSFVWSDLHQKAFEQLKDDLTSAVDLSFPSPKATMTITTDASARAIGACLHQVVDGHSSPLSFFSRKLSETESRYSTFDRELLAIFAAVKKWKDFIHGHQVTVFTDHRPIVGAFHSHKPRFSDRQQRQFLAITEYVLDIVYVAGRDNVVAETLSRIDTCSGAVIASVDEPAEETAIFPIDLPAIARQQDTENFDATPYKSFPLGELWLYCETSQPNPRPVVPHEMRKAVFNSLHGLAHPGRKATFRLINTRFFWPHMKADIESWCDECLPCQQNKIGRHTKKPFSDLPFPTQRFTTVHIDIVGPLPLPESEQLHRPRYLLTMIDAFSRWVEASPMCDISATTVAKHLLSDWIARFGPPLTLISDRGTQFRSELLANLTTMLGIHHIRTTAYNPRANGMIERVHRSIKTALKSRKKYWLDQLPIVLFGLRIFPDNDNNSPYSIVTGEQPIIPPILVNDADMKELSTQLHELIHPYRLPQQRVRPRTFVPDSLQSCTHVWLRLDRVRAPLEAPYQGPYEVIRRSSDTFTLLVRSKPEVVSIDRLKPACLPRRATRSTAAPISDPIAAVDPPGTPSQATPSPRQHVKKRVTFNC